MSVFGTQIRVTKPNIGHVNTFVYGTVSSRKPENDIIYNNLQCTGICNEGLNMKLKYPLSLVRESSLQTLPTSDHPLRRQHE